MHKIPKFPAILKNKRNIETIPLEVKGFIFRANRSFFYLVPPMLSSTV